jgi:hypothetical protein
MRPRRFAPFRSRGRSRAFAENDTERKLAASTRRRTSGEAVQDEFARATADLQRRQMHRGQRWRDQSPYFEVVEAGDAQSFRHIEA